MEEKKSLGKKIFFLYPHSVIQDELISTLIQHEFEVYFLKDHTKAYNLLKKFGNSICFINIDETLAQPEWETYIKKLQSDPEIKGVQIGILSYNNDRELIKKYLMEIRIKCGFIQLKLGVAESTKIILKTLEANEAKGRRKFVRANCENDSRVTFNVKYNGDLYSGNIIDISSIGMACSFDSDPDVKKNSLLREIQLKLRGTLIGIDGIVIGKRDTTPKTYVLIFDSKTDAIAKAKIRKFINAALQRYIDSV